MFRVLQFNIQFGQSWNDETPDLEPVRLERTIEELQRSEADLIFLQELEKAPEGGLSPTVGSPNYARIAAALGPSFSGLYALPAHDPRELPFGVGLAVFARGELLRPRTLRIPSPPIHFSFGGVSRTPTDRLLVGAEARLDGRLLQVFNVHLLAFFMLKSSSEEHPEQRAFVIEELRKTSGPALIGGDFNVSRHEPLIRQMAEAGFSTVQSATPTWRRQPLVLDHLFFNKGLRCLRHEVRPTTASDHHLLLADFDFV